MALGPSGTGTWAGGTLGAWWDAMDDLPFRYAAACDAEGCGSPPRWKIAAAWSHGPLRELKNYGLSCDRHRNLLVARALGRREALAVGDDEAVGPVDAFPLPRPDEPTPDP